jgi:hypothetical protein
MIGKSYFDAARNYYELLILISIIGRAVVRRCIARTFFGRHRAAESPSVLPLTRKERFVDLNYLHHRQQVSVFMSDNAACASSRIVHRKMAEGYAALIAGARRSKTSDPQVLAEWAAN